MWINRSQTPVFLFRDVYTDYIPVAMNPYRSTFVSAGVCRVAIITAMLFLPIAIAGATAKDRAWNVRFAACGAVSIGMLGNYTNEGLGGGVGFDLRPFPQSKEIELFTSLNYDRFANKTSGSGSYSFSRAGAGLRLYVGEPKTKRIYLTAEAGLADVRIGAHNGFPPYHSQSHASANLYGAGGIGMVFLNRKAVSPYAELALIDILDTLFGDYRFVRVNIGLKL